jgi:hypothetical protein
LAAKANANGMADHEAACAEWLEYWRLNSKRQYPPPIPFPRDQIISLQAALKECDFGEKNSWVDWVFISPAVTPREVYIVVVSKDGPYKMVSHDGPMAHHFEMIFAAFTAAGVPVHEDWNAIYSTWEKLTQSGFGTFVVRAQTIFTKNKDVMKDIRQLQELVISGKPGDKLDLRKVPDRCKAG